MNHTLFFASRLRRMFLPSAAVFARRLAVSATLGSVVSGCQTGTPSGDDACKGAITSTVHTDRLTISRIERVDLLLDIDNSRSMEDKQQILALAVPDLVRELVNPPCLKDVTGEVDSVPDGPLAACPPGTKRKIDPITDIHVGVISSSLGGHGADACASSAAGKASNNDKAHLLDRKDPSGPNAVETYQGLHFLAWDPEQALTPPGEADIDQDSPADTNGTALVPQLRDMVIGVGEIGCGYESQLESWYRFLVDPAPPDGFVLGDDGTVQPTGIDEALLLQRKAFLRPDSLVEIILLTDENDCSIRESGQYYLAAQQKTGDGGPFHLPRARAVCDQDPHNACCFSCGQAGPKNADGTPACPDDPTCKTPDGKIATLDTTTDNINLRCHDQKRRFGIDFLYGTDRYVQALTSATVTTRTGEIVPNPLFTDLDPSDAITGSRGSSMVLLAGIVGVPWQDIARTNANGVPDLVAGLDLQGRPTGGYKSATEMMFPLPGKDYSTWDVVLGDPAGYPQTSALPRDPLMLESIPPRTGVNPITGEALVTSDTPLGNKINGHERSIWGTSDLQYACIFPLVQVDANGVVSPAKRDCTTYQGACDCQDPDNDNPLCQVNPVTGEPTDQVRAKAYPGLRELQVLKDLGGQGIVGSVCPAQLTDTAGADFGYRAAVAGLTDRLEPQISAQCLGIAPTIDSEKRVTCSIVEAVHAQAGQEASCNACAKAGRAPVSEAQAPLVDQIQEENPGAGFDCFCEIPQLDGANTGDPLWTCQNDPSSGPVDQSGATVDGFCYVDPAQGAGNPAIVDKCPDTEKRILRFVGAGAPHSGATLYVACVTEEVHPPDPACADSP